MGSTPGEHWGPVLGQRCCGRGAAAATPRIVAYSAAMKDAVRLAETVAPHETTTVLLGETGTGKGLLARHVHACSPRGALRFVALNCAGLQRDLTESELFGHERGAFTGAAERKLGLFEAAAGGTLFLDEIGELDPAVQAKLLKAIEDKTFRRVGGLAEIEIDVRLVAATHKDLEREVSAGRFREDLFYRLSVFAIRVPALRERRDDIVPLAAQFLEGSAAPVATLSATAQALLERHAWPGNVRELRNAIERASIVARGEPQIEPRHFSLPAALETAEDRCQKLPPPATTIREAERVTIAQALHTHRGNVVAAAAQLGISRGTVYRKARKYSIAF
jgi:transcriptional regulator with PAS, ATPase and Fis domain